MQEWHRILSKTMSHGTIRNDRTGVGTYALFAEKLVFDNSFLFPAVTTKQLGMGQVCAELACFLRGYDNLHEFHSLGCKIWDGNGSADYWLPRARVAGDLGRIYGVQWRDWRSVGLSNEIVHTDQLQQLVEGMHKEPHGRRHVVTAFNPGELSQMCLPPCHVLFQAFVTHDYKVDLLVFMRSVDLFLGLPFDIASYAILQRLLAKELGLPSGFLTFFTGDTHIYLNHQDAVHEVLSREVRSEPTMSLHPDAGLFNFLPEHAALQGYNPHPAIAAPLNV
jgi:thymidylate synthase